MHVSQKYLILCFFIIFQFLSFNVADASDNPFKCKLSSEKPVVKNQVTDPLIFKGFILIDKKIYGLVTIDGEDLEVVPGQEVKGYTILTISKSHLEYRYRDKRYSVSDFD